LPTNWQHEDHPGLLARTLAVTSQEVLLLASNTTFKTPLSPPSHPPPNRNHD